MFEKIYSSKAKEVMQLAEGEARRFNNEYIGTEHILLGLIKQRRSKAYKILSKLGVDFDKIKSEVEKMVWGPEPVIQKRFPLTPRAKKIIEYAIEEARSLNKTQVDTDDLLIGLLCEKEGIAFLVLHNLGVELEDVRAEAVKLLAIRKKKTVSKTAREKKERPVRCKVLQLVAGLTEEAKKEINKFLSNKKECIKIVTFITVFYRDKDS